MYHFCQNFGFLEPNSADSTYRGAGLLTRSCKMNLLKMQVMTKFMILSPSCILMAYLILRQKNIQQRDCTGFSPVSLFIASLKATPPLFIEYREQSTTNHPDGFLIYSLTLISFAVSFTSTTYTPALRAHRAKQQRHFQPSPTFRPHRDIHAPEPKTLRAP